MNIGATIENLRKSKGMTQGELAEKSKIKQAYISQIENNKKEPNLSTLRDISFALGVPLPAIFLLALEIEDVPENKQAIFNAIKPSISGLLESIYRDEPTPDHE
jgi:transcriptional regulator with XRE-family HTH domain